MNYKQPLVSVVIPAYNAAKFLPYTIDSVLNQTYKNIELIIVNDGSTDNTVEVLKKLLVNFPNSRIYNNSNHGVSYSRNYGISNAYGEFIALLDADDIWHPNNIELKVTYLLNNSNVDYVFSDMGAIDEFNNELPNPEKGKGTQIFENILFWNGEVIPGPSSNLILRKEIFNHINFNTELSTSADQYFTLELSNQFTGYYLPKKTWSYRIFNTSMSRNISVMEKDHRKIINLVKSQNWIKDDKTFKYYKSKVLFIVGASWWKNGNSVLNAVKLFYEAFLYDPKYISLRLFVKLKTSAFK